MLDVAVWCIRLYQLGCLIFHLSVYAYKTCRYHRHEIKYLYMSAYYDYSSYVVLIHTAAKKNGIAVQKIGNFMDEAKICAINGSPIACPILSKTTIPA
jgi:hypothetical protein